jgi:hypothetical protein
MTCSLCVYDDNSLANLTLKAHTVDRAHTQDTIAVDRADTHNQKGNLYVNCKSKLEIPGFGSGLKSQEPGAGKVFHRNLALVLEETLEY